MLCFGYPHVRSPSPTCDSGTSRVPILQLGVVKVQVLQGERDKVLSKDSVEIIQDRDPAFYSKLCLIEKASCHWSAHEKSVAPQKLHVAFQVQDEGRGISSSLHQERRRNALLRSEKMHTFKYLSMRN